MDNPVQGGFGGPQVAIEGGIHKAGNRQSVSGRGDGDGWPPGSVRPKADQHSARPESLPGSLKGMNHAPERDSSKRPAEERDVKGRTSSGQMFDRAHPEVEVAHPAIGLLPEGLVDARPIRVDRQHGRGERRVLQGQPSIAAADLEDALSSEARKSLDQPELEPVGWIGR